MLGIPNTTGPRILVFGWGPAAYSGVGPDGQLIGIRRATLTGPDGRIGVKWVDTRNPTLGRYLPNASAVIVPLKALERATQYAVTVELTDGTTRAWRFHTFDDEVALKFRRVRFGFGPVTRREVCVRHVASTCTATALRRFTTVRIRGRHIATGPQPTTLQVGIDGVAQVLVPVGPRGGFDARYPIRLWAGRERLHVTLAVGDDIIAYVVRIRPSHDPVGTAYLTGVMSSPIDVAPPPVSATRRRTGPDPRGTAPCSRCS